MIAVDTNILVYAHRNDLPFFNAAARGMRELAQGRSLWAIPWPCIHEFYSTVTSPRRFQNPSTTAQALDQMSEWMSSPFVRLIGETASHMGHLQSMIVAGNVIGPMVHDARIAAICVQHGVREFWTVDRDFSRFPQLKCKNPLVNIA
jgi:toxin-antitoxin system PIN domain toxin